MQIDVLSQSTLKLTLSKLDMFDLDIKYESLSGKNPEIKCLLQHVLKSIQSDKKVSFDFSGEKLFIEAFPRLDGGCLLYISCPHDFVEEEVFSAKKSKKSKSSLENRKNDSFTGSQYQYNFTSNYKHENHVSSSNLLICEVEDVSTLENLCKCLFWHNRVLKLKFKSSLYGNKKIYRLLINCSNYHLVKKIIREYGTLFEGEKDIVSTKEYFKKLANGNAVELVIGRV